MQQIRPIGGHDVRHSQALGLAADASSCQSATVSPRLVEFPALLTDNQSAAFLGISVRTFLEFRNEPWMPRPVMLSSRIIRWPRDELNAAIANMPRQAAPAPQPAQLLRGKIEKLKAGAAA